MGAEAAAKVQATRVVAEMAEAVEGGPVEGDWEEAEEGVDLAVEIRHN